MEVTRKWEDMPNFTHRLCYKILLWEWGLRSFFFKIYESFWANWTFWWSQKFPKAFSSALSKDWTFARNLSTYKSWRKIEGCSIIEKRGLIKKWTKNLLRQKFRFKSRYFSFKIHWIFVFSVRIWILELK